MDLTDFTVEELINLRGQVSAAIERRQVLEETPEEIGRLASRYTSVGGDPAVLRAALDNPKETP